MITLPGTERDFKFTTKTSKILGLTWPLVKLMVRAKWMNLVANYHVWCICVEGQHICAF